MNVIVHFKSCVLSDLFENDSEVHHIHAYVMCAGAALAKL